MKLRDIAKGTRATKVVALPWPGRDEPVPVLVRVLHGEERAEAVAKGRAYAEGKGRKEPRPGDEDYDLGVMAETLARCCRDVDKPDERFFESASDVLESVDPDRIAFLYEHWQLHQDDHAPARNKLSPEEFVGKIMAIAEAGEDQPDPFLSMRPGLRWAFTRSLVVELLSARMPKSPSSSDSTPVTTSA